MSNQSTRCYQQDRSIVDEFCRLTLNGEIPSPKLLKDVQRLVGSGFMKQVREQRDSMMQSPPMIEYSHRSDCSFDSSTSTYPEESKCETESDCDFPIDESFDFDSLPPQTSPEFKRERSKSEPSVTPAASPKNECHNLPLKHHPAPSPMPYPYYPEPNVPSPAFTSFSGRRTFKKKDLISMRRKFFESIGERNLPIDRMEAKLRKIEAAQETLLKWTDERIAQLKWHLKMAKKASSVEVESDD